MNHSEVIEKTVQFVQQTLAKAEGGHDWWHIYRVWNNAKHLANGEPADLLVVELAALLHDIADAKFYDGDKTVGPKMARQFLEGLGIHNDVIDHVVNIMNHMSFRGGIAESTFRTLEFEIVQDADRLDAIGAIGIGRAFSYGGFKGRAMYDPNFPPVTYTSEAQYQTSQSPTLNHFYEKLFLLKDRMNTPKARQLAEERHQYMEGFVRQFIAEFEAG